MRFSLANLIVRGPLPRISVLMERVVACTTQVPHLFDALAAGDHAGVEALAKEISRLEHQADEVKADLRAHSPSRFFYPVDRRDMLKLIAQIDKMADCAEDVGVLLTLRKTTVPDDMRALLPLFISRVNDTVITAQQLVATLDSLVEAGFSGRPASDAQALIKELSRKEHEADKIQDQLGKLLWTLEDKEPPLAIFMWSKVLNKLGDIANHAENVGEYFRLFMAS